MTVSAGDFICRLYEQGGGWGEGATHIMKDGRWTLCGQDISKWKGDFDPHGTFEDFNCKSCKSSVGIVMKKLPEWLKVIINNWFNLGGE